MNNVEHKGFEPIIDTTSKVLILGSFPSVKSREVGFYYGNKQNRFWKMLGEIFCEKIEDDKENKIVFLKKHNIALWDVFVSSDLTGSADLDLLSSKNKIANFKEVLTNSNIEKILCNGKAAYTAFISNFNTPLPVICLPSTSSANPRFTISPWKEELEFLKK